MTTTPFTLRSPEDVLALAVYGLGFHPSESLVLVALTRDGASFQARVDIPSRHVEIAAAAVPLVDAAVRNGSTSAFLIAYSADAVAAHLAVDVLDRGLAAAGLEILAALHVQGDTLVSLTDSADEGRSFDISAHPLLLQAAFDGRPPLESRDALAATLRPSGRPHDRNRCARILAECDRRFVHAGRGERSRAFEVEWARRAVRRAVGGRALGETECARLLVALRDTDVRDVVWVEIARPSAQAHVDLWLDLTRIAQGDYVAAPAALLAFAAWLSGNGSLAWCAVDRCRESEPAHSLALLVSAALEAAVPPSEWVALEPAAIATPSGGAAGR